MTNEARLEDVGSGLAPVTPGWFVVNARDTAWRTNPAFGMRAVFETDGRVLRDRPDLEQQRFEQLGIGLAVLEPGKPSGLYHAEINQEGFLVLHGECVLLVEGEERPLRAWDFVHCPPGTAHAFVGAGDGPCILLMLGARTGEFDTHYPESELARGHGASAEAATDSPHEAYAPFPHWALERPDAWRGVPWA